MTWDTKKNIDYGLPALLAVGAAYWYFRKSQGSKDWKNLVAIILLVYLVGYAITSQVTRRIINTAPLTPLPNDTGLKICSSFDPAPYANRIKADAYRSWYSVGFRDVDAYTDLAGLGNCEFTKVHNYWQSNYHQLEGETLREAINAESTLLDHGFAAAVAACNEQFARNGIN